MNTSLSIKGFIETSFLDWDSKIISVVFLPYCNFRCPFCHNFGLVIHPEQYENTPQEKVEKYLMDHRDFIDGICLSGGEPFLHKDKGLFPFLSRMHELGFLTKIDTNGSDPEAIRQSISENLVDYIAMDIKAPLDARYHRVCGVTVDLDKIKESIGIILEKKIPYEFRTTAVPGLLNRQDAEDLAEGVAGADKLALQQFAPKNAWSEELKNVKPYAYEELAEMAEAAKKHVKCVVIRGA